jgi:hypothetical protein
LGGADGFAEGQADEGASPGEPDQRIEKPGPRRARRDVYPDGDGDGRRERDADPAEQAEQETSGGAGAGYATA